MNINNAIKSAFENYQAGNLQEAVDICKKIVKIQPNNINAVNLLGIIFYQRKDYDSAMKYTKKLITLNPMNAEAYYILGHSLQEKGEVDEATIHYQRSLAINPNFADAFYNLGTIFQDKKKYNEAISCYQKALYINPSDVKAYYNLGFALQEKGQHEEAITFYQKALLLNPNLDEAHARIGLALQEMGRSDEAIDFYRKANQCNPKNLIALCGLGSALQEKKQFDEAIPYYYMALQLYPKHVQIYINLSSILLEKRLFDEALQYSQKAIQISQNHSEIHQAFLIMGNILIQRGQVDEAERYIRHAIKIKPDDLTPYHRGLLMIMNYNHNHNVQTIFSEHVRFGKQYAEYLHSPDFHTNDLSLDRRLRIGYVSPDFRRHAVAYFIEPVLGAHNKEHFEIFCYSNSLKHDEVTKRIQGYADQWRNIAGISDGQAVKQIQKDEIDILVDLAGYTAENRILIFARKPAPIQISWIGYLATTGLSTMDYKIADNYSDPPGKTDQFYTERLMRLPESFLCYLPDRDSPEVKSLPILSTGHITFGCFNNFTKVTPEVLTLWAKILDAVSDSRLIIKCRIFSDKSTCEYVIRMFTAKGIATERIDLQSWDLSPKHLEAYNAVDIGLDTFPFNGAATTCEALWMGVPVITLSGTAYHSSVGTSLLSNVGLPELVANTSDEYISIAVNLAKDLRRLRSLRECLRGMMKDSPLCDAKRFTLNLETCYRTMWENWCNSEFGINDKLKD